MSPLPAADGLGDPVWSRAHERLVEDLRAALRIPSVNPPDPPGGELAVANWLAGALTDAGLRPKVYEPVTGRGSVIARLRGDGSRGEPLLLLSHLDVVPAPPAAWTHDPFAGDIEDGYVWGRGAVDMKDLLAMELAVVRLLAEQARAAGRDPASEAIPGLTRDIILASTADEEAGGLAGIGWLIDNVPEELRASGAINESGAVSLTVGDQRLYPIGVAEKGYLVYRIHVRGTWGHGSMPRSDNAAVLAARVVTALAEPGPTRLTPVMRAFFEGAAATVGGDLGRVLRALASDSTRKSEAALSALCDERYTRVARALVRDTISPDVIHAGIKYNVIPGEATVDIDCRQLAGTTEAAMRAEIINRLGPELAAACTIELVIGAEPVEAPVDSELYRILAATIRAHDPAGTPLPFTVPFATDAKHLARLGVPSYGFSPLRIDPDESYLGRFHGVDERVSLEALRWGLPVLYDAVVAYCG
ncbi:MAG TPA: M20/M25/M40 family metallo-hydrolase [Candidatus Polarisedimenticolia bacterium]|nr:M20/M25/M40 family metallo-hydrolase [Candidatus Polarisedimenticolia bacterium]